MQVFSGFGSIRFFQYVLRIDEGIAMKNYTLKLLVCAMGICLSVPFFSYAEFDQYNYYDSPVSEMGPTIRDFKGNSWRGTNTLGDWNLYFKVNPDWDPLDPASPMYVWGPSRFDMDSVKFTGTNYIGLINAFYGGGYYNIVDSTFESDDGKYGTQISNTDLNGNAIKDGMYEITTSLFRDSTSVAVNPQSDGGSPGVEISGSTFQDNTDINVADGGTLSINDSVINLANEDIMDRYLGTSSPLYSLMQWFFNTVASKLYWGMYQLRIIQDFLTSYRLEYEPTLVSLEPGYSEYYLPNVFVVAYYYQDEHLVYTEETYYCSFPGAIQAYFRGLGITLNSIGTMFSNWFYPLDPDAPYWRYWNTDTGEQEATNLAGVLYNITWYLGEIYKTDDWDAGSGFQEATDKMDQLTSDMNEAESAITDSVLGNVQDFVPDPDDVTSLAALGYIGDYLQRIYVALGGFGIPVLLSLVLAVCMQLIGYFKYKGD